MESAKESRLFGRAITVIMMKINPHRRKAVEASFTQSISGLKTRKFNNNYFLDKDSSRKSDAMERTRTSPSNGDAYE